MKDAGKVDRLKDELSEEEVACMVVNECKSHVPTLVCVVNAVGTLKKHFSRKSLDAGILLDTSYSGVLKTLLKRQIPLEEREMITYLWHIMHPDTILNSCIRQHTICLVART